jgi:hypothetical protein
VHVADNVLFQKRIFGRVEQAAVEGGDVQRRAADIDDLKEILEPGPQPRAGRQQRGAAGLAPADLALERIQAVVGAVAGALTQRQQLARLGVQDKQQPIQDDL